MTLKEYHRKRDFKKTAEPRGAARVKKGWLYVIQKHDASHLHYDFRLQLGDVLLSWAVPKGPSLDPAVKRLAMHVEDHPVDYGDFEGIIPEGEYGGGTVMLWDRGSWEPLEDATKAYKSGALKFTLHGEKLQGGWMLVRKGGGKDPNERAWFLFKERDEYARPADKYDVTKALPLSVKTKRDLDEIADQKKHVWHSKGGKPEKAAAARKAAKAKAAAKPKARAKRKTVKRKRAAKPDDVSGARRAALPKFIKPALATLTDKAPTGSEWLHEIKFDGYRMICRIDDGRATFFSRNEQPWTSKLTALVEAAGELPVETAMLDGEVVAIEADGTTSFQALQGAFKAGRSSALVYYVFDLLHLDGYDLREATLEDRKKLLADIVPDRDRGPIRFSEHLDGSGAEFFAQACKTGLEGIICKRRDRPYVSGRGHDWLKVKCQSKEEFVIGGFTPPSGSRTAFGALLLGYYNSAGELTFCGKVGTGFDERTLKDLLKKLKPLEQETSPFANLKRPVGQARLATWVEPKLVGQIEFTQWTNDGMLRHPSFQGLREDKPARSVVRDRATPVAEAVEASHDEEKPVAKSAKRTSTKRATKNDSSSDDVLGITISHPDRVLYPEQDVTKRDLALYYEAVAEWMLPHVVGRPVVLVRCPEGRKKQCFFQKHPGPGTPKTFRRFPIRESDGTDDYLVIEHAEDLVALVQMGVLEIHVWGSRIDELEKPDRLVFDLDPDPSVPWPKLIESAKQVRQFLEDVGLVTFLKTTGGKGLHLVAPIARRTEWDDAKEFCKAVAEGIVTAAPEHYTSNMSKAARKGKVFIDYLRNGRGATSVAAYSTRAREGATVSVPIAWEELTPKLETQALNVNTVPARLSKLKRDPWAEITDVRQSITAAMRRKLST